MNEEVDGLKSKCTRLEQEIESKAKEGEDSAVKDLRIQELKVNVASYESEMNRLKQVRFIPFVKTHLTTSGYWTGSHIVNVIL